MSTLTAYNGHRAAHTEADDLPHIVDARKKGRMSYSLARALSMADPRESHRSGLEYETSQEMTRRFGRSPVGIWVPHDAPLPGASRFDLTTQTGAGSIRTVMPDTIFDALRMKMVCARLGAQVGNFAGGLSGSVALPVKSAAATVTWVREGSSPASSSAPLITQAIGEPHDVIGYTDVTRRMLKLGLPDFQRFVISDLAGGIAAAVDRAAINGAGSNAEPLGLIPSVQAGFTFSGGTPTYAGLAHMKRVAGQANADAAADARMAWISSSAGREALELCDKGGATATGKFAWESRVCRDDATGELVTVESVLGAPAAATEAVPSGASGTGLSNATTLLYGNFRQVIIQLFGAVDILVNPYSFDASASVRIRALQPVDVLLLHADKSFVSAVIVAPAP